MDFDSIDEKTAFKLGFAQRCFELGFAPDEVTKTMEKSAFLGRILPLLRSVPGAVLKNPWAQRAATALGGGLAGFGLGGAMNAAKDFGGLGLGLAGGAGLLGGGLLGYSKAKLDEEEVDEDSVKAKELADTYKTYAERLKAQKEYQQYLKQRNA